MFLQNLISKKLGLVKKALSVKVKVNLALQKFGQNLPQQENDPSDLSKTDVYALSNWVNKNAGFERIPLSSIEKPPSAELRPDQIDPFDQNRSN